ncbi:GNAT family N-acetyltransferase [Oceanobacillus piezotolerans]|uniref:GNAT family N-acetyltransferase n=1 Tax=Oceanobacillus piezotolerans TaxID=2448030 RepID=A0A498DAF1_9BACI|nr:GNAT family N-acetyltransferase [Oceanobacillus piezotolerans]RLL48313.1 GNAT family N-acetyltransferase [Oceanobacillus piezotolerans]
MNYKICSVVDPSLIHQAFLSGFSDYAIPMNLPLDPFIDRFFGPEGNTLEDSFIAFKEDVPVGLILGGIRKFDGYKNLRCGTLCITPEFRGRGVSQELFQLFIENGNKQQCERFSLEVLKDNERAIRFYEKQGFKKGNIITYFNSSINVNWIKHNTNLKVEKVGLSVAEELRNRILSTHINWQNEVDYFIKDHTAHCFAAYGDKQVIAALVITKAGIINFLYVLEGERCKGVASNLISYAVKQLNLAKLSISMPDNINMADFLRKTGFKKVNIEQYEMYKMV